MTSNSIKPLHYCEFCTILEQHRTKTPTPQIVINQNDQFFAFQDYQKSAQQHILVCTKQHIESALLVKQPQQLKRMEAFGLQTLAQLTNINIDILRCSTIYRFHLPPHISEFHIHLHCFVIPFISKDKEKRIFGHMAYSVDKVIQILENQAFKTKILPKL